VFPGVRPYELVAGGWHELGEQETCDQVEDAARGIDSKHETDTRDLPGLFFLLQHRFSIPWEEREALRLRKCEISDASPGMSQALGKTATGSLRELVETVVVQVSDQSSHGGVRSILR
jgi:hypothetical protein